MIKLHPRYEHVTRANLAIQQAVIAQVQAEELTYAELVSILAAIIQSWTRTEIREERHGPAESGV